MRITNNIPALRGWRQMNDVSHRMERSMERLSSGFRINRSGDDVAGLGISERMRTHVRGLQQSMRNTLDGISVVQVAEASLGEVSDTLQRARELALAAANGVLTPENRELLQQELDHILAEVNRVAGAAEFNGRKLLGGLDEGIGQMVESLRRSWLANAEQMIQTHYGLQGDGATLKIVADQSGSNPAWVSGTYDASGKMTNLELHINLDDMQNLTLPNGGSPPQYADRVIAHEMVHAVMDRTMNVQNLPQWFKEGAAEFIHGADERLASDLAALGGAGALVSEIDSWEGGSADYAAAYAAVKYLHSKVTLPGGIRALFDRLEAGDSLDVAINTATAGAYANTAAFVADFKAAAGGQAFIGTLNLADSDPGGIISGMTAETVVPDTDTDTWNPLLHFTEIWPENGSFTKVEPIDLQVGIFEGEQIRVPDLAVSTYRLRLTGIDLKENAAGSLEKIDAAIKGVVGLRTELGAIQNRLEHTYNVQAIEAENLTAAESRIRDLDIAQEITRFARDQVLMQSSAAMLAQANVMHRDAMRVLLGA
ncbi:MAG TPA: flagellinolysin [Symbiobacteriaceae bacterium]|nr:flagellinolysin [Symbiobacteriaceae bacterium]